MKMCMCVCVCVQCGGLGQSFQNQIAFQPPEDSEAKKNSDLTEIIINVREDHTHTHLFIRVMRKLV